MEIAQEMEDNYKSDFGKNYQELAAQNIEVTPEDEEKILGTKKNPKKEYAKVLDDLIAFDNKIKAIALNGKESVVLAIYNTLDKLGLYSAGRLMNKKIEKLDVVANGLERMIDNYAKSADFAKNKTKDLDTTKFKAYTLMQQYNDCIEGMEEETSNLDHDAKQIKTEISKKGKTPELTQKLMAIQLEKSKLGYDLRDLERKKGKISVSILKSKGASKVYRAHELIKNKALTALEIKYAHVDIMREQLSVVGDLSKDHGLVGAVKILASSQKYTDQLEPILKESSKAMEDLFESFDGIERQIHDVVAPDTDKLDDIDKGTNNEFYSRAMEEMDKDLGLTA